MANQVRFGVGVDDRASKPIRDIRDAWHRLQTDGSQALTAGIAAAASLQAFNLLGSAIGKVTDILGDSVRAAIEEERSVAKLGASLKANVAGWDGSTDAIEKQLAAQMRLGFADDEQRQALALLLPATHDQAKALDDLRLAMDLATFKGIDLRSAAEALIKTEGGHYRILQTLIGSTKDITTAEQALAAVHTATAGAAEALADTEGGKLKAAQIDLGESMEKLGGVALPVVASATTAVASAAEVAAQRIAEFGSAAGDLIDRANRLTQSVGGAAGRVPILADAVDLVTGSFNRARSGIFDFDRVVEASRQQTAEAARAQAEYNRVAGASARILDGLHESAASVIRPVEQMNQDVFKGADYFGQFTTAAQDTGAGLDIVSSYATRAASSLYNTEAATQAAADAAVAAQNPLSAEAAFLDHVAFSAATAARNLAALGSAQSAADRANASRLRAMGETAGAGISGSLQHGYVAAQPFEFTAPTFTPPRGSAGGGRSGGGGGTSRVKVDAEAAAQALRTKLAAAYDTAKRAADAALGAAHDKAIDAIDAEKKQAYAVAQTTYDLRLQVLETQKAGLYAKANADQAALDSARQSRNMRDLGESVQDANDALAQAMAGGDPEQIKMAQRQVRNANEALSDAQQQAAIDAEKSSADKAAAALDDQANADKAQLTLAQQAADALAAQQTAAEDQRYAAQQAALDKSYDLLKSKLDDEKTLHSKTNAEILALYDKAQAPAAAAGAKVAAALIAGLKGTISAGVDLGTLSPAMSAADWKAAAATNLGPDVTPAGTAGGPGGLAGTGSAVTLNVNITVQGSVVDPNSAVATQIARGLAPAIAKVIREDALPVT